MATLVYSGTAEALSNAAGMKVFDKFNIEWEKKEKIDMTPNVLPPQALREIQELIRGSYGSVDFGKYFDWSWNVKDGPFVGKLPQRISNFVYKKNGDKLSTSIVEEIGNIGKRHMPSTGNETMLISFSKNVDWQAGKFGDGMSCFWNSRKDCRENIKANEGFSVQAWHPTDEKTGKGRCWAAMMSDGKFLVIYNSYGVALSEFARAVAIQYNCDYRAVDLYINNSQNDTVYVNNGNGYVIGNPEELKSINVSKFNLPYKRKTMCHYCRKPTDNTTRWDGRDYCENCTKSFVFQCYSCSSNFWYETGLTVNLSYGVNKMVHLCESCADRHCISCGLFGKKSIKKFSFVFNRHTICETCEKSALDKLVAVTA